MISENDDLQSKKLNVTVYTWIKVIQAVLMLALGVIFIVIGIMKIKDDSGTTDTLISCCLGIVLAIYGTISIISGYFLERSPASKEILMGASAIGLGITLIIVHEVVMKLISYFISITFISFACVMIWNGIDRCIGKVVHKNVAAATLEFIGALAIIALCVLYLIFQTNEMVLNYVFIILGGLFFVLGVASFVMLMLKVRNTKLALKEMEEKKKQQEALKKEINTKEVKVVDINELKRKPERKVFNRKVAEISNVEKLKQLEASSKDQDGTIVLTYHPNEDDDEGGDEDDDK